MQVFDLKNKKNTQFLRGRQHEIGKFGWSHQLRRCLFNKYCNFATQTQIKKLRQKYRSFRSGTEN